MQRIHSIEVIETIKQLREEGKTPKQISDITGVNKSTIANHIYKRKKVRKEQQEKRKIEKKEKKEKAQKAHPNEFRILTSYGFRVQDDDRRKSGEVEIKKLSPEELDEINRKYANIKPYPKPTMTNIYLKSGGSSWKN